MTSTRRIFRALEPRTRSATAGQIAELTIAQIRENAIGYPYDNPRHMALVFMIIFYTQPRDEALARIVEHVRAAMLAERQRAAELARTTCGLPPSLTPGTTITPIDFYGPTIGERIAQAIHAQPTPPSEPID